MGDKYYKQWQKRKKIKRSPVYRFGMILFGILIVAVSIYIQSENQQEEITYSSSQNNQGFYFYSEVAENTYYASLNGLIGEELKQEMHTLLNTNFTPTSYGDAREYLADADRSLEDPTKVWNVYDGVLAPAVWDEESWHREHVWPNSRLGLERVDNSDKSIASDLHNLRAVTPSVNSSRGDRFYSDGSGEAHITDDGGFYPGDEHKGDVARIIFYMFIMYEELDLRDDNLDDLEAYTPEGAVMGILTTLLEWHKEDPVSDFERARNQSIYEIQNNRNPFIDKPEYVHLIFENQTIEDLKPPTSMSSWIDRRSQTIYG
ncbi:MAG: endonuclease [Acholeplasmataceae bacterium]|nr:endonuclease [Acholeplasmataceae bacterium]